MATRLLDRMARFIYDGVFGRWPRVTKLHPLWAPAQPLLRAIAAARVKGAKDALIVSDHPGIAHAVAALLPGKVTSTSNADFTSGLFEKYIERGEQFDFFLGHLGGGADLVWFPQIIAGAKPYMRPGGTMVGFYMNTDRPLGASRLPRTNCEMAFAGSPASVRAMTIYADASGRGNRSQPVWLTRLLFMLALNMPQFWLANRVEAAAVKRGRMPEPRSRTSASITVHAPWPTSEDLFDFEDDDGSVEYAAACGAYLGDLAEVQGASENRFDANLVRSPETAVILTFGQSNAANFGAGHYTPRHGVYAFSIFDMNYYRAADPLPGATGYGGSVWSRLGDKLIEAGLFRSVIFVPIAVGGSYMRDWTPLDGFCYRRLKFALLRLKRAGIGVDMFCWHQGEADANRILTSAEEYTDRFRRLVEQIRSTGAEAPIYVAVATLCANGPHPYQNHEQIRLAQRGLASKREGLLPGPDTDQFAGDFREDGCHFSEKGLDAVAQAWLESIVKCPPRSPDGERTTRPESARPASRGIGTEHLPTQFAHRKALDAKDGLNDSNHLENGSPDHRSRQGMRAAIANVLGKSTI